MSKMTIECLNSYKQRAQMVLLLLLAPSLLDCHELNLIVIDVCFLCLNFAIHSDLSQVLMYQNYLLQGANIVYYLYYLNIKNMFSVK